VEVKISKRSGDLVTLRELVEEVGADACRFVFLSRSADSQMDFDIELARRSHRRTPCTTFSTLMPASPASSAWPRRRHRFQPGERGPADTEAELDFIRKMLQLPEVVEMVATKLERIICPTTLRIWPRRFTASTTVPGGV